MIGSSDNSSGVVVGALMCGTNTITRASVYGGRGWGRDWGWVANG